MKKSFALFALALVLIMAFGPFLAFAAEADTGDAFDPEALVVGGVALAPLISVLISILKGWVGIDKKYIPLVNVLLGTVAVLVVGVVNQGMSFVSALIMTLGVVLGSAVFHDTFGHAANIIKDLFGGGKPPQEE